MSQTERLPLQYYALDLPWTHSNEDRKRRRRILVIFLIVFISLGIIIPNVILPEVKREVRSKLPPNLARILQEKPKTYLKAKPKVKVKKKVKAVKTRKQQVAKAKKKAKKMISSFSDSLASMRESLDMTSFSANDQLVQGAAAAKGANRAIVTSKTGASKLSGGITTAGISKEVGGGAMGGRSTTRVTSSIAGAVGGGSKKGGLGYRNKEQVRRVFDKNKGALTTIYLREQKKDATLEGTVVLHLKIAPTGEVLECKVLSSELNNPKVEKKIATRCMMFDFGVENVLTTKFNFPVTFLPY